MFSQVSRRKRLRPISVTVGAENYMNLGEHFVQEGLANRITPFRTHYTDNRGSLVPMEGVKNFDTEKVFDNVMHKFKFGGIDKPGRQPLSAHLIMVRSL